MPISLKLAADLKKTVKPPEIPQKEKLPFLPDGETASAQPPTAIGQGRKILVVDDNPVVLQAFELKLKSSGFAVVTTSNCAEVASMVEKSGAELIILDINFPAGIGHDWNGFTILQWLRRFPELASIPVILISGEDSGKYLEKSRAEGAVAFFQKPVPYTELLATMLRTLRIQQ